MTVTADFWDTLYTTSSYSRDLNQPVVSAALNHFGDIRGKTILELGCGPGSSVLHFASCGANVIGVDISEKAITDLNTYCASNNISNVRGICASALDLSAIEPVDFVFGSMILHHLEPFPEFVIQLKHLLKPGGGAFFWENNAASKLLVWFRNHVVGNLWVPKYGDNEEFPLTPYEVDQLRAVFQVKIVYPEMYFFRLASAYLMRHFGFEFAGKVDAFFYRRKWLLRYSYRQYVEIVA